MNWLQATALLLLFEGLLPFLAPRAWRQVMTELASWRDGQLRFLGLCAIVAGLVLSWLAGR